MKETLAAEAVDPMPMSAEDFGRFVQQDLARWTQLARERNIQLDS
jgi:tripartite-type tricarboxylate transporter receptor subunit TctC